MIGYNCWYTCLYLSHMSLQRNTARRSLLIIRLFDTCSVAGTPGSQVTWGHVNPMWCRSFGILFWSFMMCCRADGFANIKFTCMDVWCGVHIVCIIWCAYGVHMACIWFAYGVHMCLLGLFLLVWCEDGKKFVSMCQEPLSDTGGSQQGLLERSELHRQFTKQVLFKVPSGHCEEIHELASYAYAGTGSSHVTLYDVVGLCWGRWRVCLEKCSFAKARLLSAGRRHPHSTRLETGPGAESL